MKKFLLSIVVLLLFGGAVNAAAPSIKAIQVTDIRLVQTDGSVAVTFNLKADRKTVRSNNNLVVNPVLQHGSQSLELPPVTIQGGRARIAEKRYSLSGVEPSADRLLIRNGEFIKYGVTIPYAAWMHGSQLVLNGVTIKTNIALETELGLLAENLLQGAEDNVETTVVAVPIPPPPTLSMAEKLAQKFPFIVSNAEMEATRKNKASGELFDYNMPLNMGKGLSAPAQNEVERFVDTNRDGSLTIYFRQASRTVERGFMDNNKGLVEMVSAVRAIMASNDSKVVRVILAGFASPEGSLATNDRLAWNRAVAVKEFLINNTEIDPKIINVYNGSVDWEGLRILVAESDLYDKYRVMDIIDNTPIWDSYRKVGRHGELMRLNGGDTYRYMLREYFPKLRNAAYIKVVYENK